MPGVRLGVERRSPRENDDEDRVRGGETQIKRILSHAIAETTKLQVNALVFVGDAMEENADILVTRARELGRLKVPAFMFQEGQDFHVEIGLP